MTVSTATLSA